MTVRTSNAKARSLVQALTPFKGNNTFAEYINGIYVVFSYGHHFPLFVNVGGTWYANDDRFSVSPSKHKSQLHPLTQCIDYNTAALKALYA